MLFRFIGEYTNGHTSNTVHGVTFYGTEPAEVTDKEAIRRLSGNPEFVKADPLDHDGDGEKGGSPKAPRATRTRATRKKATAK